MSRVLISKYKVPVVVVGDGPKNPLHSVVTAKTTLYSNFIIPWAVLKPLTGSGLLYNDR